MSRPLAVVTGASRGIGKAIALTLARAGHDLVLVATSGPRLDAVAGEVTSDAAVRTLAVDLTDSAALADGVAGLGLDRVDVLVHAAGIVHTGELAETTTEEFRRAFDVNVTAVAALTRLLEPALVAAHGTVVMISSGSGRNPSAGMPIYVASKFALEGLAGSLRLDLGPRGVRVVTVAPGQVDTDMQAQIVAATGRPAPAGGYLSPQDVADAVLHTITQRGAVEYLSLRPPLP